MSRDRTESCILTYLYKSILKLTLEIYDMYAGATYLFKMM